MKYLLSIILILISHTSKAEWTYLTKNTSGVDFFLDYSNVKEKNGNLLFKHLQNRKTPDKWGSLSTTILREVNCKTNKYKNLKFAYYYGEMGTILEKEVKSLSLDWYFAKPKSVNDLMVKSVCRKHYTNSNKSNFANKENFKSNKICNVTGSKNWTNCTSFKNYENDIYVGQFKNNKRNGLGFYKFFNTNNKFFGTWKNGKTHNKGVWIFPNNDIYIGGNNNSKNEGVGFYKWSKGDVFLGTWKNDFKNGPGVYIYQDGTIKTGIWENDNFISSSINNSLKQKLINLICDDNSNSNSWDKCIGSKTYNNGTYVGYFKKGKRSGKGVYKWNSKITYVGFWKNGFEHGEGFYEWPNEELYIGDVRFGKRTGVGFYKWTNNDVYLGDWKENSRTGYGTYLYNGGKIKAGLWKNSKFISSKEKQNQKSTILNKDTKLYQVGSGTGFSVSSNGHIITNHHVINGCQKVNVFTKENSYNSKIVASDIKNDLSLLKVNFKPEFVFPITNTSPQLMDEIYVAGFPFGNRISSSIKITKGIISSLTGFGNDYTRMQVDAAMQPGNSGGPVYSKFGNIYGVAVAKLDYKYSIKKLNTIPELTNFAIKASMLKSFLEASNVKIRPEVSEPVKNLGKKIQQGTFYISCMMTKGKYDQMKSKKVLFNEDKFN